MGTILINKRKIDYWILNFIEKFENLLINMVTYPGLTAKKWIDITISDNFHSVTYTKYSDPKYRNSKDDLLAGFEKAYRGKLIMSLIIFIYVSKINA